MQYIKIMVVAFILFEIMRFRGTPYISKNLFLKEDIYNLNDQTIINNLDGLVNVRCDQFGKGNTVAYNNNDGNMGLYLNLVETTDGIWYNFYGTKVYVYGFPPNNAPIIEIKIDTELAATLDFSSSTRTPMIVFTSEDLHAITVSVKEKKTERFISHLFSLILFQNAVDINLDSMMQ